MAATVVRYRTKPDRADENQALVEKVFAELNAERPEGLRYLTLRLADGVTFVHVAMHDTGDGANPLTSSHAFAAFQAEIADRLEEPPTASPATLVASYRFPTSFGDGDA